MKYLTVSIALLAMLGSLSAQTAVDSYIEQGLANNMVLKQKHISLEQAKVALKEAGSLFFPKIDVQADYTFGSGGREIDIPIGDLLNGVYSTLNDLTQSSAFPQVQNVNEELNPYNFYNARISTSLPLYNHGLLKNRQIAKQQLKLSEQEVEVYKRDLVKEIKLSYYNYQKAYSATIIYKNSIEILEQNLKVVESLVKNGSGLQSQVLKVRSELEKTKALLQEAEVQTTKAGYYLNFLINEDLKKPITPIARSLESSLKIKENQGEREELKMLQTGIRIDEEILALRKAYFLPQVGLFVDLGSQAFDFEYNNQSQYVFGGINLTIPLFQGGRKLYQKQDARLALAKRQIQYKDTERKLVMSAQIARDNLEAALNQLNATKSEVSASRSYYLLVNKGFKEGINPLIELIDAQNQWNNAQLSENIALYQVYIREAELERETANYQL